MKKFVVVGVQRSGTTFIGSSLDSHPQIKYVGEVFKVRGWYLNRSSKKLTRRKAYSGEYGYTNWSDRSVTRQISHFVCRNQATKNYLDYFYNLEDYDAVGFKLMSSQARRFKGIIPYIQNNDVKVIHIIRENILKTHISRLSASSRSVYHSDKVIRSAKINVPITDLIKNLEKINQDNRRWESLFANTGNYLQVSYESFVKNRTDETEKMCSFLDVEFQQIQSSLVKLNPDSLKDIIENYQQVESQLSGSEFEWALN